MNILEDYLSWKKYTYFRMDGSTTIADRRDLVDEFQTNPNIFIFLLSTRAGGLGVTLTAADTVIFYDNDWNPTMEAQATDRVHRIGQTKEVSVYRLITRKTVEERIIKRAKQKQNVQHTVYSGGAFRADVFKPGEVVELLFDEVDQDINEAQRGFLKTKKFKRPMGKPNEGRIWQTNKIEKKEAPEAAKEIPKAEPRNIFAIQNVGGNMIRDIESIEMVEEEK